MKVLDHLGLGMWSLYAAMAWSTENTTTHPHWSEVPSVCHITSYVWPMLFLKFPFYPVWITTSPFHFVVGRIWLHVKTNMDKKSGSELELPGFEARLHLMGMCPQGCDRPLWTLLDCSGKWQGRAIPHRVTLAQRKHIPLDTLVPTHRKVLLVRQTWGLRCVWCVGTEGTSHRKQTRVLVMNLSFSFLIHLLSVNACWVRWA